MNNSSEPFGAGSKDITDVFQAGRALGEALAQTPVYQEFLSALRAINHDPQIQQIAAQMRNHQRALQLGGDGGNHQAELARLQAELDSLPIVQHYRKTELETLSLFRAVDALISQAMGLPFARNAHRRSCGCGS
ncbi:MAG: YlbF family regulator [Anaerolineales bacterium]|nr:YlbF family regulator [Anaerolineales bacterium]MDW8447261.1 YlbF family regulator [Anaerolineales bacterium]